MLKHANYDIENGLKSLEVGFGAIFSALIDKKIEVYQTTFPLSEDVVDLGLKLCYNNDVSDEYMNGKVFVVKTDHIWSIRVEDVNIVIVFEIDRTVFYRK